MGSGQAEELAEQLYDTLYKFYLKLDDDVSSIPAHGHGSPCGAVNWRSADEHDWIRAALQSVSPTSEKRRVQGVRTLYGSARADLLQADEEAKCQRDRRSWSPADSSSAAAESFQSGDGKGQSSIDTRQMLAFGGGHIEDAINMGGLPELSIWAGWLLDPEKPLLLVLEADGDLEKVVRSFLRTGYSKFAGYLVGGMKAWDNAAMKLVEIDQITVHELKKTR